MCRFLEYSLESCELDRKLTYNLQNAFWPWNGSSNQVIPGVRLLATDEYRMYILDVERYKWAYWRNKTTNGGFQRGGH
jgi:hypothetical protein